MLAFLSRISNDRLQDPIFNLHETKGKPTTVCGKIYVYSNVGLRRSIRQIFITTDFLRQSLLKTS